MSLNSGGCGNSNVGMDSADSVRWFTITSGNTVLYAQMNPYASLDGEKKYIRYSYNQSAQTTTISMPYFWDEAYIDPDYSVLVSDTAAQTTCNEIETSDDVVDKWYLWVPLVLGVVAVVAAGFFVYTKYLKAQQTKKEHSSTGLSDDEDDVELE